MNTELLLKVKAAILAEPRKFDIRHWFAKSQKSPCGTVACLAGHAVAIGRRYKSLRPGLNLVANDSIFQSSVQVAADALLGLDYEQSKRLFLVFKWPDKFHDAYRDAEGNRIKRARVAAKRIDHFIKTGGRE